MIIRAHATSKARIVEAACRTDLPSFIRKCFHTLAPGRHYLHNWHLEASAYYLEQVYRGNITHFIINTPPRTLKSIMVSVALPAFIHGHNPTKRIIAISYSLDLAAKHSNDYRAIVTSSWYRRLFPTMEISKNTEFEITTTQYGYRLATSIDGTLTGRGGDYIIIDDPLKPLDAHSDIMRERVNDWYRSSVPQRRDDISTAAIILAMQRLHENDLTGMLLNSPETWIQLKLAAIAEREETIRIGENKYHLRRVGDLLHAERMPISAIEVLRSQLGADFYAHYQQEPVPREGAMIKRQDVHYYDRPPQRTSSSAIVQSWDTAQKDGDLNDFSACTTWLVNQKNYYLLEALRGRLDFWNLTETAIARAHAFRPNIILVEDVGVGTHLVKELQKIGQQAVGVAPQHNKKVRVFVQSEKFRSGLVWFPKHAPWLSDLEAELFAFPNGDHDDQVDSIVQALAFEVPKVTECIWNEKNLEGLTRFTTALGGW